MSCSAASPARDYQRVKIQESEMKTTGEEIICLLKVGGKMCRECLAWKM